MSASTNKWLIGAALMSLAASLAHIGAILGGGDWYRFFGAGEQMARLAEAGSPRPAIMTGIIAAILAGWGLYALSGAGAIRRLPLVRTALVAITLVLVARVVMGFFRGAFPPEVGMNFIVASSLIVAVMAAAFGAGTLKAWARLSERGA
jgi:hypothetical protein